MRASSLLTDLLSRVADAGRALTSSEVATASIGDQCAALLAGRGEATELALARRILDRFGQLDAAGKHAVFSDIVQRFGVDREALDRALARYEADRSAANARAVHFASEPRSQELIRRLNRAPAGTQDVVAMREALLAAIRSDPALRPLDADFQHLLSSWFNRGFLELRRIDWSTSAETLEKIIGYEAVHAINGWDDLRGRVASPDRRLYGFFHPAMRADPVIFVEVALDHEIPAAIGPILDADRTPQDPSKMTTAVFYSISNCQNGLRGVSFGNFLIKQVVEVLRHEFPALRSFVTLSPLPGLRRWVAGELAKPVSGVLTEAQVAAVTDPSGTGVLRSDPPPADIALELAARYLVLARTETGQIVDPVARFHLGNGARLERVNADADASPRGQEQSWGVMVNYLYDLGTIERNHEAFANKGELIAAASVHKLARKP
jgi:malonyl-CoA decarboxylase